MPLIQSAKKRVKVAAKASARNARTKRTLRDSLKAFAKALEGGKSAEIAKTEHAAMSAIDMAAKKAVIHKNKAARQKSRLAKKAKAAGVKPVKAAVKAKPAAKTVKKAAKTTPRKPASKK